MKVVDRFKRRILDLAIRGKLVPQDPNDEPASELLARIRAEKAKDERGGRGRKGKRSAVGSDGAAYEKSEQGDLYHTRRHESGGTQSSAPADAPFELPDGWAWCKWGDISSSVQYGYNAPSMQTGRMRMVRITDIQDECIKWRNVPYCQIEEPKIPRYKLLKNDILFARTGGTVGKSHLITEMPFDAVYAGYLVRTRCAPGILPQYAKLFLESELYWSQLRTGMVATAQPNFNGGKLSTLVLPLPPLAEQKRIVARIEELFKIVDSLGRAADGLAEAVKRLDKKILDLAIRGKLVPQDPNEEPASELLKRIAATSHKSPCQNHEAPIDPPFDIPESWEWCRLGEISDYGRCRSIDVQSVPMNTWSLDLEEIEKETGRLLVRTTVADKKSSSSKHLFCKGMVLYSKLRTYLNKVLVADMDGVCTSEIIPISLGDGIDPEYIRLVLMSPYLVQYTTSKGYGVKMPRVGTTDMREAPIPVPPFAEQRRIVERVYELKHIASALTTL